MSLVLLFFEGGGGAAVVVETASAARPSLNHAIEVTDLSGRTYRWSQEERSAWDIPASMWSTRRGDGYAEATFTLQRPITRDFPDLGLLNEITVTADDGTVCYQGRITGFPRTSHPSTGEFFSVTATGWMSHATDRTFREIYVDRDLSRWQEMSVQRRVDNIGTNARDIGEWSIAPDVSTGQPALILRLSSPWSREIIAEAYYDAQGIDIESIYYAWKRGSTVDNTNVQWSWDLYLASTDILETPNTTTGSLRAAGPGTGTLTASSDGQPFAAVRLVYGVAVATSTIHEIYWTVLAAYGSHGLPKSGTADATNAEGFYASDVIENIVSRWCPELDVSQTVDSTSYVIGQLAFLDPVTPYDAITQINAYHQYELAVWEDHRFHFTQPTALDDWDWEIRLEDPDTTANLQGDSIAELANGIVVRYTDLIDGTSRTLTPETNTILADTTENNPANLAGIDRWTEITVPYPTLEGAAEQIGIAALSEFSRPKAPGEFTTGGYIRDRHGNWQPGSRVRAGQRVVVSDHPNDAARRINDTSWDDTNKTLRITTDTVSQRLEGYFARITQGRSAIGVG